MRLISSLKPEGELNLKTKYNHQIKPASRWSARDHLCPRATSTANIPSKQQSLLLRHPKLPCSKNPQRVLASDRMHEALGARTQPLNCLQDTKINKHLKTPVPPDFPKCASIRYLSTRVRRAFLRLQTRATIIIREWKRWSDSSRSAGETPHTFQSGLL